MKTKCNRNNLLIVGACGVGKTWLMKQLLIENNKQKKIGRFVFHEAKDYIIVGKYDGSTFEGSDKLSMSVMADLDMMLEYINSVNKFAIYEGDRFTNYKFINKANPIIYKILGDGQQGRTQRGSEQSSRQIKSIQTRVNNINSHTDYKSSKECYISVVDLLLRPEKYTFDDIVNNASNKNYNKSQTILF